jgi:hypothetical protein
VPTLRAGKPAALEFLEKFHTIDSTQVGTTRYRFLVRKAADSGRILDYVGWVEERQLVVSEEALVDPNSRLHRKAFIVTRPRALRDAPPAQVSAVPVYLAPQERAAQAEPLRLLKLLFIWGETEPGSERGYFLLGNAATMLGWDNRATLLGWVPKARVCEWNTREAFEWHQASTLAGARPRRSVPALVYYKPEQAHEAWMQKDHEGKAVRPLFKERFTAPGEGMTAGQMRFLLLPWPRQPDDSTTQARDYREKYERGPDASARLRHVGIYTGFQDAVSGAEVLDVDELNRLQQRLARLREETSRLEVVFVLDATSSMIDHGSVVASLIEELLDDLGRARGELRVAVTYYRDVNTDVDPATAVEASALQKVTPALVARLGKELRDKDRYRDGWDPPEQVFRGLLGGIRQAQFSDYSRKVVILLGDMGNNTAWDSPRFKGPTLDDLAQALNPRGQSPILFFPFQVNVDPDRTDDLRGLEAGEKLAAAAFKKETLALLAASRKLRATNPLAQPDIKEGDYFATRNDRKRLLRELHRPLEVLRAQQVFLQTRLDDLAVGRFTADVGPELEKILDQEGIKLAELRKLKGAQVFETGYVWDRTPAGAPQIAQRLLVSEGELDALIDGLSKLASRDPARRSLRDLIPRLAATQTGESQIVADLLFDALKGITFRSPLLSRAVRTFKEDRIAADERDRLLLLREQLADLRRGLAYRPEQYVRKSDERGNLFWVRQGDPVRLEKKQRRSFHLGGDRSTLWYWLDYDREVP